MPRPPVRMWASVIARNQAKVMKREKKRRAQIEAEAAASLAADAPIKPPKRRQGGGAKSAP